MPIAGCVLDLLQNSNWCNSCRVVRYLTPVFCGYRKQIEVV
jgi:hypothetical protein